MNLFRIVLLWVMVILMIVFPTVPVLAQVEVALPDVLGNNEGLGEQDSESVLDDVVLGDNDTDGIEVSNEIEEDTKNKIQDTNDQEVIESGENDKLEIKFEEDVFVEDIIDEEKEPVFYSEVMRDVLEQVRGEDHNGVKISPNELREKKGKVVSGIEQLIKQEKEKLAELKVPGVRERAYLDRLEAQLLAVSGEQASFGEKVKDVADGVLDAIVSPFSKKKTFSGSPAYAIPERPASFGFNTDDVAVGKLNQVTGYVDEVDASLLESIGSLFKVETTRAIDDPYLPVIGDIEEDGQEVVITPEIESLAKQLDYNPVNIYNYLQNNISYEPYFGAKKGAEGCLAEQFCNDIDASTLAIALMRASDIPARYKKSVGIIDIDYFQDMLGLEHTVETRRTVFGALHKGKYPVFSLNNLDNDQLDDADFSNEEVFALDWTHVEIFYPYDARGGNFGNVLDLSHVEDTASLRDVLRGEQARQWIAMDVVVRPTNRVQNAIIHDSANFDTEGFWYNFLQSQNNDSPMEAYGAQLLQQTGNDIEDENFHSGILDYDVNFQKLPPALPYVIAEGSNEQYNIFIEKWSVLPNDRRYQVQISLIDQGDNSTVYSQDFYGSEITNRPIELVYTGSTPADNDVIESYGGIAATPAELVDIVPQFITKETDFSFGSPLSIGDELVMRFVYTLGGGGIYRDEKFSTAGNQEGIYVVLSHTNEDEMFDNPDDVDRASKVLLDGNAQIGRQYLREVFSQFDLLEKSLDYDYVNNFSRAVVTQNRILGRNEDNVPTTFDFKGLTIDATTYINDNSRRGNYKTHLKDFRLLLGLEASHREATIFEDLTGLDAVATVQGIQYAYNTPGYSVHVIDSDTPNYEDLVNGLDLSGNTKTNMIADIGEGNTIVTPNRYVEDGTWRGILYISLDPDWTGSYAIGEQGQQNGGWMIEPVEMQIYLASIDGNFLERLFYYVVQNNKRFTYEDKPYKADTVLCSIQESEYNNIVNNSNVPNNRPWFEYWSSSYGAPCYKESKTYGNVEHAFIVATNGAKFYSPATYSYWIPEDVARSKVFENVNGEDYSKFRFNPIAGTYSYNTNYAVYYQPVQPTDLGNNNLRDEGNSWIVDGKILSKLLDQHYAPTLYYCLQGDIYCGYKQNWVLNKIGYPIDQERTAAESEVGTNGYYQTFVGGQVYVETEWIDEAYYVPGSIADTYNSFQYAIDGKLGTGGEFGFPSSDPIKSGNTVYQDFEHGYRLTMDNGVNLNNNVVSVVQDYSEGEYRELMLEGLSDLMSENNLFGLAANYVGGVVVSKVATRMVRTIAKRAGKKAATKIALRFIPGAGWFLAGVDAVYVVQQNAPLYTACQSDPFITIEGTKPAYYCGKLAGNVALVTLGIVSDQAFGKLNKLAVNSLAARRGKDALFTSINSQHDLEVMSDILESNSIGRNRVTEVISRLDENSVNILGDRVDVLKRLVEGRSSVQTFNGFVNQGPFIANVRYRVDPRYLKEFTLYTNPNNFDVYQTLLNNNITRPGFFGANDIEDAIQIFNGMPSNNREIIFVKKLDGTIVLTPRYSNQDQPFPHPVLAGGEDILAAGTIEPMGPFSIRITNKTGHYKVHGDDLLDYLEDFENLGYSVNYSPI